MSRSQTGAAASPSPGDLPPAIVLSGPTAAGKTDLALALARRFPVELISVDSAQVYRGLQIGVAKPDARTLQRYPHALIDLCEPEQAYSVARFVTDCEDAMRAVQSRGRVPLLVGGTVLYLRALRTGLDSLPGSNPKIRAELAAQAAQQGWPALHARLARIDPVTAAGIAQSDSQRIQRALEIHAMSGQPPSVLRTGARRDRMSQSLFVVLTPAVRQRLHEKIAERFAAMLAAGLVEEVEGLMRRPGLTINAPSMRAVGYRQVWQHLCGQYDLTECRARAIAATRQLAKRQLTGLRQLGGALWYDPAAAGTMTAIFRRAVNFFPVQCSN